MTDNEIIKALKCCGDPDSICAECPIKDDCGCNEHLANYALDIIKRQQAEIENLKVETQSLRGAANSLKMHYEKAQSEIDSLKIFRGYAEKRASDYRAMRDKYLNAKSEAVKEFAMKLKCGVPQETGVIRCSDIDNLVKEMVGENNDL